MQKELYNQAKKEFEAAFADYMKVISGQFGYLPAMPPFFYSENMAKHGKQQKQSKYYLKETEKIKKKAAKRLGKKYLNKRGVINTEKYELAVFLHQLDLGETFFLKRSDWVSKKRPSDKLNRIHRRTEKRFESKQTEDGSGWNFMRIR